MTRNQRRDIVIDKELEYWFDRDVDSIREAGEELCLEVLLDYVQDGGALTRTLLDDDVVLRCAKQWWKRYFS